MIFKKADKEFERLGYVKTCDSDYIVSYEKEVESNVFKVIDIGHKKSGFHLIQCYQKDYLTPEGYSIMFGLTFYEAKLALKKAREKGWKVKKDREGIRTKWLETVEE